MSQKVTFNFSDAAKYVPYTGSGAAVVLKFNGLVRAKIVKYEIGTSQASQNHTLSMTFSLLEDDVKGNLYAKIPISGVNSKGDPNINRFFELLWSAGWTAEMFAQAASNGQAGDVEAIIKDMVAKGTECILNTKLEEVMGRDGPRHQTSVTGFATPTTWNERKVSDTLRLPNGYEPGRRAPAHSNGIAPVSSILGA
jgi:hypothetical protein